MLDDDELSDYQAENDDWGPDDEDEEYDPRPAAWERVRAALGPDVQLDDGAVIAEMSGAIDGAMTSSSWWWTVRAFTAELALVRFSDGDEQDFPVGIASRRALRRSVLLLCRADVGGYVYEESLHASEWNERQADPHTP